MEERAGQNFHAAEVRRERETRETIGGVARQVDPRLADAVVAAIRVGDAQRVQRQRKSAASGERIGAQLRAEIDGHGLIQNRLGTDRHAPADARRDRAVRETMCRARHVDHATRAQVEACTEPRGKSHGAPVDRDDAMLGRGQRRRGVVDPPTGHVDESGGTQRDARRGRATSTGPNGDRRQRGKRDRAALRRDRALDVDRARGDGELPRRRQDQRSVCRKIDDAVGVDRQTTETIGTEESGADAHRSEICRKRIEQWVETSVARAGQPLQHPTLGNLDVGRDIAAGSAAIRDTERQPAVERQLVE